MRQLFILLSLSLSACTIASSVPPSPWESDEAFEQPQNNADLESLSLGGSGVFVTSNPEQAGLDTRDLASSPAPAASQGQASKGEPNPHQRRGRLSFYKRPRRSTVRFAPTSFGCDAYGRLVPTRFGWRGVVSVDDSAAKEQERALRPKLDIQLGPDKTQPKKPPKPPELGPIDAGAR